LPVRARRATFVSRMSAISDRAVRVLTVDDHAVFRVAARDVIAATPGFELVAEAVSGTEALKLSAALEPDLVLMDVRMPGMDGIEAARCLRDSHPDAIVVLISLEDPDDIERPAHGCGAVALLRKQDFCPALLHRVWDAHRRR
jgi:two-component system, NarL family, invasion response regulator UvrY